MSLPHVTRLFHPTVSTRWAIYVKSPGEEEDRLVCWREKGRHADIDTRILPALVSAGYLPRRFKYESYAAFSHHLAGWPPTDHLMHAGPSAFGLSLWDASDHDSGFEFDLKGLTFAGSPLY